MKHVRDNIYEHDEVMLEAVQGSCFDCCLRPEIESCEFKGAKCAHLIGLNYIFKLYEEPKKVEKIKLADVSFKCAVLTPERSEILQKAVFAVGGRWPTYNTETHYSEKPFLHCRAGRLSCTESVRIFFDQKLPEVTCQQALDLLATVEKPEPVFDIKLRDEVLCRDAAEAWEIKNFARTRGDCSNFATFGARYLKMIRFTGNEQYHGTTDTPSGWWEAKDGKPVWVTK